MCKDPELKHPLDMDEWGEEEEVRMMSGRWAEPDPTGMPCRLPSASKPERASLATSGKFNSHMLSVYNGQGSEGLGPMGEGKTNSQ